MWTRPQVSSAPRCAFTTRRMTNLSPPRSWAVRGIDGPVRGVVEGTVEPLDNGARSRVTIELDFEGHGLGRLLVPLVVRRQAQKELPRDLGNHGNGSRAAPSSPGVEAERAMSEANVETIRRHYEIRHGKRGKRREVGMDDWRWEHPLPCIALVRRCRSVRCSASSTDRRADPPLRGG